MRHLVNLQHAHSGGEKWCFRYGADYQWEEFSFKLFGLKLDFSSLSLPNFWSVELQTCQKRLWCTVILHDCWMEGKCTVLCDHTERRVAYWRDVADVFPTGKRSSYSIFPLLRWHLQDSCLLSVFELWLWLHQLLRKNKKKQKKLAL